MALPTSSTYVKYPMLHLWGYLRDIILAIVDSMTLCPEEALVTLAFPVCRLLPTPQKQPWVGEGQTSTRPRVKASELS